MKHFERIAVDIVLLPVRKIMDEAIRANRELLIQNPGNIVLGKENCLPNVSLAMGCIDKNTIPDIEKIIVKLAEKYPLKSLNFINTHIEINSRGEKVTIALIEKTNILQSLHEEVMMSLRQFFSYDVTPDMLVPDEEIGISTLLWIKSYPEKSSFERFSPHITLGYGKLENYSFPRIIGVSQLAVCHLGNHCTCRKVLKFVTIGEEQ